MKSKRQFRGASKRRQFFDRKVRTEGYSRTLSLGKIIPEDWRYVRIYVLNKSDVEIRLNIQRLLGAEINAQPSKSDKRGQQNTPKTRPNGGH